MGRGLRCPGAKVRLRVVHLTLPSTTDPEGLISYFDREMINGRNWHRTAEETPQRNAWVHGYESPDNRHILMLVGLKPRPGEARVPLSIVTTLSDHPGAAH